ncbi:MAG: response regulator [Crocinitomicaceae bacterium]
MLRKKKIKIAIVEDDFFYNRTLSKYINSICNSQVYPDAEFEIKSFTTAHDAIHELEDDLNIMVLDYYLFNPESDEKLNGEDVLDAVNKHCDDCKVIMISAQKDASTAIELLKKGIYEYIDKNINSSNRLGSIIQKAVQQELRA